MATLDPADIDKIAVAILNRDNIVPNYGSDKDTNAYIRPSWALGRASLNNTMLYALRDKVDAILATVTAPEDTAAISAAIVTTLVPAVVTALQRAGAVDLTEAQVQAAAEAAVRNVLGAVDNK
jgi:hypothetical protein